MRRNMILLLAILAIELSIGGLTAEDVNAQDSTGGVEFLIPDDIMFGATWNGIANKYGFGTLGRWDLGAPVFATGGINALYSGNGGMIGIGFYIFNRPKFTVGLFGGPGLSVLTASKFDIEHENVTYTEGQTGGFLAWKPSDDYPGVALMYLYTDPVKTNKDNAKHFAFLGLWVPIG